MIGHEKIYYFLHCKMPLLALNCRGVRPPLSPLSGADLPPAHTPGGVFGGK